MAKILHASNTQYNTSQYIRDRRQTDGRQLCQ